jgi:hypothetical protein
MKRMGLMMGLFGLFLLAQIAQADWTPAIRLTWNPSSPFVGASGSAIAVDSAGNPHVVWHAFNWMSSDIYYRNSTDGGATWGAKKRLTWTSALTYDPDIVIDGRDTIHVVWRSQNLMSTSNVYYKASGDLGSTWTAAKKITTNASGERPRIAVDSSGNLFVVWYDDTPGTFQIYFIKSMDNGVTWTPKERLTYSLNDCLYSDIAVDSSGNLHLVFSLLPAAELINVIYERSTDGGEYWPLTKWLDQTSVTVAVTPAIAAGGSKVFAVWFGNDASSTDPTELYFKRSTSGGLYWGSIRRLTWTSGNSYDPDVGLDSSGNPHVIWADDTPGNTEIYYRTSTDGEITWTPNKRLTWNLGDSEAPEIAVAPSGNLHVVWGDSTPGNYEVYYRRYVK